MSSDATLRTVVQFYDNHPINEDQILGALAAKGIATHAITEDHLKEFDQDHYGGIAALESLAAEAGITRGQHVLDICSGMGGPARYLAHTEGCRVTGIDLTQSRVHGATRLTKLARLDHLVDFHPGNALELPFADNFFDVAISQEAWAHIPDKPRLVAEAVRVLKPAGVIAFTDIVRLGPLSADTAQKLRDGMTFTEIESPEGYRELLAENACTVEKRTDLGGEWTRILQQRLAMYRSLKDSTVAKFGVEGYERYDAAYSFFVSLYEGGMLGGVRYVARKTG
ncbi:MAG: class I SAM-dependent methyltransferase [Betaproteobacteria bacterium]|nr:class I SAM-dependent methyltransferase [Betaproteobacteria bacterium]